MNENENVIEDNESSENEFSENESSDESENENVYSTVVIDNMPDYTNYFENLQTIGILICALLVAHGLAFAFFKGFKR